MSEVLFQAFAKFLEFSGLFYCLIINVLFILLSQATLTVYHTLIRLSSTFLFYFFKSFFALGHLSDSFNSLPRFDFFVKRFFKLFFFFKKLFAVLCLSLADSLYILPS